MANSKTVTATVADSYDKTQQKRINAVCREIRKTSQGWVEFFASEGFLDRKAARPSVVRWASEDYKIVTSAGQRGLMLVEPSKSNKAAHTNWENARSAVDDVLDKVFPTGNNKKVNGDTDWLKKAKAAWEKMTAAQRRQFKAFIAA